MKSETLTYGTAITAPEDPAKVGYTFVGWNPEVDATVPAKDVTYEAVYQVNVYAVARRMPVKDLKKRLPRGVYIIEGRKVAIK